MADTIAVAQSTKQEEEKTIESEVELAKRSFALRKFEDAVEHYANALEILTAKYGDGAPESADLLFLYGKALLENAVAQSGVVGKEEAETALKGEQEPEASGSKGKGKGPFIEFSGDAEEEEEGVALLAEGGAEDDDEDEQEGDGEGGEDGDEPEDDFNAAWEVLDLARALYAKAEGNDAKLKLADTYMALGDVSLETEKFEQAVNDYTSGLKLKEQLLPFQSRQIAEGHYRLCLALDLTPGKLAGAVEHAEKAVASLDARIAALETALASAPEHVDADAKMADAAAGEEKPKEFELLGKLANDSLDGLTKSQIETQIKEFKELRGDVAAKADDLKTLPEQPVDNTGQITSVTEAANQALDEALNPGISLAGPSTQINDLSGMVKKKKKVVDAPATDDTNAMHLDTSKTTGKRKADDDEMDTATTPVEKKVKLAEETDVATAPASEQQ